MSVSQGERTAWAVEAYLAALDAARQRAEQERRGLASVATEQAVLDRVMSDHRSHDGA
jgi:hypothetical protein